MEEDAPVKAYRGPPPRKDLVISPSRRRDWVGNDLFNMSEQAAEERKRVSSPPSPTSNIGIAPGLTGSFKDPHLKSPRDYGSDYSKLAMQGGHKGLLQMNGESSPDEIATSRRQKGCDNISEYNRVAMQGGHKDLLRMDSDEAHQQDQSRKSKGEGTMSDYVRIAKQGGHKDLLVIEENKPSPKTTPVKSKMAGGDWFAHENNNAPAKVASPKTIPKDIAKPSPVANGRNVTEALPGGREQAARQGKKRFEQSNSRREAPFATNY